MSIIEKTKDVYNCLNYLLNKVKLESKTSEDLLNGLLNISSQCKHNDLCLLYGNLIFERLLVTNAKFFEVFTNPYFCKNILKHITIGRYRTDDRHGMRMPIRSLYAINKPLDVQDTPDGALSLGIKSALGQLAKEGVSSIGKKITLYYAIDSNFTLRLLGGQSEIMSTPSLTYFSIEVSEYSETAFSFYATVRGLVDSGCYRIQAKAYPADSDIALMLYTCGLIGNLNIRSDLTDKSVSKHELILGIYLRYSFKEHLYWFNERWRFGERHDEDIASLYSRADKLTYGRGFSQSVW